MNAHMSFDPTRPFDLPALPPEIPVIQDLEVLSLLKVARIELAELKGFSAAMPNSFILMAPLTIVQESVASSEIEAIHTTVEQAFQQELFPELERRDADREVLRYRDAVSWGFKQELPLSTRLIQGIHHRLLPKLGGDFRKLQNGISNKATNKVVYTPPIASKVSDLVSNWEKFVNAPPSDWDPLIVAAIAHYQFEAIHPFADGNGRVGRMLLVLHLVRSDLLIYPTLYISGYLNEFRARYYEVLLNVTRHGDWRSFVMFMLTAFAAQAKRTKETLHRVMNLRERTRETMERDAAEIYSLELVDELFASPVTSPTRLAKALKLHYTTASRYLYKLESMGVLHRRKVGKNQLFANRKLIALLSS